MKFVLNYIANLVVNLFYTPYVIGILLMLNIPVFAQNINTEVIPFITQNTARIHDATFYEDGRILIAGDITLVNGNKVNGIARLHKDGQLDESFNAGDGFNGNIKKLILTGTKIIIAGNFSSYNGTSANGIIRLNNDGSIDESFNSGTGLTGFVYDAIYQPDGKIVVAGNITKYNNNAVKYLVRINPDGTFDPSFRTGFTFDYGSIFTIELHDEGKILIGGSFEFKDGLNHLARVNSNGTLDPSFNKGGSGPGWNVYDIHFQIIESERYILICGNMDRYNDVKTSRIIRLTPDGTLDDTFIPLPNFGGSLYSRIYTYFGNIYVYSYYNMFCLNSNGEAVSSFKNPASTIYWSDNTLEGEILIEGIFYSNNQYQYGLYKITPDGEKIIAFSTSLGSTGTVATGAVNSKGEIFIGGDFNNVDNEVANSFAKLNQDGSVNPEFNTGTGFKGDSYNTHINASIKSIVLQDDGKILVGGFFRNYNGIQCKDLIRINNDGSFDLEFYENIKGLSLSTVEKIDLQSNGKILVGGDNFLIRLNIDGSIDDTFAKIDYWIRDFKSQPDGKIFLAYNSGNLDSLVRLDEQGNKNLTYFSSESYIQNINIHGDKIYMVLNSSHYYYKRSYIYKLDTDKINEEVVLASVVDKNYEWATELHTNSIFNNKILISGSFNEIKKNISDENYYDKNNIALLSIDGDLEPGFKLNYTGSIEKFIPISLNKIIVTGNLTRLNNHRVYGFALIEMDKNLPSAPVNLSINILPENKIDITWDDVSENETGFEIQRLNPASNEYITIIFNEANTSSYVDATNPSKINHTYRIRSINSMGSSPFVNVQSAVTSIENNLYEDVLQIYPNPTSGLLKFKISHQEFQITIKDLKGNIVPFVKLDNQHIDINRLSPGIYVVHIKTSQGSYYRRILKTN